MMSLAEARELQRAIRAVLEWAREHGPVDESWAVFERLKAASNMLQKEDI